MADKVNLPAFCVNNVPTSLGLTVDAQRAQTLDGASRTVAACNTATYLSVLMIKDVLVKLKISIDTPEGVPTVWRELSIAGDASLADLSSVIVACFGWTGVHKHEFVSHDGSWKATDPQYGPPEFDDSYKNEQEVYLKDVAGSKGPAFTFNYDMTDPWTHTVEVVTLQTGSFEHVRTELTGGARNGIPEDCGGASGFQEFLEAVQDPADPEHNAMVAWYKNECPNGGPKYDPELVDYAAIKKRLAASTKA